MQNDPANVTAALRTVGVYAVCAVLSIIIGVLMINPLTYSAFGFMGILCAVLLIPVFMKWHRPLMLLSWYTPVMMFFIKGEPNLFLVMIVLSLTATVIERAMGQKRFFKVPQVAWPMFFLIGVVVITAKFTGGLGLRAFGSDVYGGKKYIFLIVAILGYFAIASAPIPPEKARKFLAMYFVGGILYAVEDVYSITPHFLQWIFWLIPPSGVSMENVDSGTRLVGASAGARYLVYALIAYYGIRGIFFSGKLWRPVVFFIAFALVFLGGYRSAVIEASALILLVFFLEGMHRTRLFPFVVMGMITLGAMVIPLASKLPYTFQRSLAFLPPSVVELRSDARHDAKESWDWRKNMWGALLPQIPEHFWLGKGYAISPEDFKVEMGGDAAINTITDPSQQALALSSDYHNGPLSVILPFGIWGAIAFVWFMAVSLWVLYRNYRYSPPELQRLNEFILAAFIVQIIMFSGGSLATGMSNFTGLLGFSVAMNRGVCRIPAENTRNVPFSIPLRRRELRPVSAPQLPRSRRLSL